MRSWILGLLATVTVVSLATLSPGTVPVAAPAGAATTPTATSATRSGLARAAAPHHFIVNARRPNAVKRLGFDIIDTGTSSSQIDALPSGTQAMVWLGQKCPTAVDAAFRSVINRLATDRQVYGYFLSDEPHISDCPKGPAHLKARSAYIDKRSNGRQRTFMVLSKTTPSSYHAFRPRASGIDLFGINPYPCSVPHPSCIYSLIGLRVRNALHAGIPRWRIVPSYQTFGQEHIAGHYYNLPTRYQLKRMLNIWSNLIPHPKLDFTYGWGHQVTSNPTLVDSTGLQDLMHRYLTG
jgi:hypothetical protein